MNYNLYESVKPIIDYNLSIQSKVLEICKPLFNSFDITYFEYDKIFNDGKVFYICTNKNWLQFSLENKMFDDEEHIRLCSIAKAHNYRYALWNTLKLENTRLLSNYFQHDVWNGLTINESEEDSFNTYSFAATRNNTELSEFFLNNLHLFDHFIVYFKQKLKEILELESKKLTFSATPLKSTIESETLAQYNNKVSTFLEQTTLQQLEVKINNITTHLTKRELQCLKMLSVGKSSKEIGNQLGISHRTVETYINGIKSKTNLQFKNELISFFEKNSIKFYKSV